MSFSVNTKKTNGTLELQLAGRFDFNANQVFRKAYQEGLDERVSGHVVLDFSCVDYMDSSALGMLLLLKDYGDKENKRIELVNCQETIREILDVVNFGKLFTIK